MQSADNNHYDDAVVGAGIVGLATAYHLAKRGRRVIVFEKTLRAQGASVRNFGMVWPIGQPAGPLRQLALRSREIWLEVLPEAGLWHEKTGSLHLAYKPDEAQLLTEFVETSQASDGYKLLTAADVVAKSGAVRPDGLLAGLWSPTEACVDPREIIGGLPAWLSQAHDVRFEFNRCVSGYEAPRVVAGGEQWHAERLWVCSGDDIQTLYPEILKEEGYLRCKLQMMRSQPFGDSWRLGPMLAAGLTLRHYTAFQHCPTLPALKARFAAENPEFDRFGIHVMASQNGHGEITIGDSHEYDAEITPFDRQEIDDLVLDYLATFLKSPEITIASHWHGIYLKHPKLPYFVARPSEKVTLLNGVGGNGMTLSFGLTEKVVAETLD